ncbi:hypothetical protein Sulku_2752 (plasmid) [Sulfuricurvum kujiense DSM 16994]|uniref:Uncharacterized protein n=1 Tax=Sulfuricurvum kujiense (strain ATCC BAA-921 / DSM 16994 / JCM 11577 / YK-1) TaxID=709032 RepID=E4U3Y5_SULKY|nr:hypothetical protein [Sulfuricurvum kujiense]ADR35401.1 hypothetical protein Sulku_2752 [Sulfuricurvum kujiense DSM 16994]
MEHFSIGIVSFAFTVIFPIFYFVGFQVRRLGAWSKREDGPKDRIGFFLLVAAIIGFAVGCFAQPLWDKASECKAAGQPGLSCVLFSK